MKKTFSAILAAVASCLWMSQTTKAAVDSVTSISVYEPTNSVLVWSDVVVDYDTLAYYCVSTWGDVRKNDDVLDTYWGGSCSEMESYYENYFPYDSSADYHISVYPQLGTKHNYQVGDGYEDYYNYVVWAQADPVYQPYYWNFFGPGPETEIDFPSIVLGGVFAYFTQGAQSGPPHHLRVNTDSDFTLNSSTNPPGCGQVMKVINYTVVDQSNRAAGQTRLKEYPQTIQDTCSGGTVTLTTCSSGSTSPNGGFTDRIQTGCPQTGPSSCGFQFSNTWQWCHPGPYPGEEAYTNLAAILYEARRTYVKIDGETDVRDNSQKYP